MRNLIVAATFAALILSAASARAAVCSGENFARMMEHVSTMAYGPKRMAMTREMAAVNSALSNADTGGACTHYTTALRIQNTMRDPFMDFHQE